MQLTAAQHEGAARLAARSLQPIHHSKLLDQTGASELRGEEGVGAGLDYEAVDIIGGDLAARPLLGFDQEDLELGSGAAEAMSGGETGDASTNNHDPHGSK